MRKAAEEELQSSAPVAPPVTEYLPYSIHPYKGGIRDYGVTIHVKKGEPLEAVKAKASKALKDLYQQWLATSFADQKLTFQLIGPDGKRYPGKVAR